MLGQVSCESDTFLGIVLCVCVCVRFTIVRDCNLCGVIPHNISQANSNVLICVVYKIIRNNSLFLTLCIFLATPFF